MQPEELSCGQGVMMWGGRQVTRTPPEGILLYLPFRSQLGTPCRTRESHVCESLIAPVFGIGPRILISALPVPAWAWQLSRFTKTSLLCGLLFAA